MKSNEAHNALDKPLHLVTYLFCLSPIVFIIIDTLFPPPRYILGTFTGVIFIALVVIGAFGLFSIFKGKQSLLNLTLLLACILFGMLFVEYLAEFKEFVSPNITFAVGGLISAFLTSILEGIK